MTDSEQSFFLRHNNELKQSQNEQLHMFKIISARFKPQIPFFPDFFLP